MFESENNLAWITLKEHTEETIILLCFDMLKEKALDRSNLHLLLASNMHSQNGEYFDYFSSDLAELTLQRNIDELLFIPYARKNWKEYGEKVIPALQKFGIRARSIESFSNPRDAVLRAKGIFVGGGNTFRLLNTILQLELQELLRKKTLEEGITYIGTSAGTTLACKHIKVMNDMPIILPPTLNALDLFPHAINCHYFEENAETAQKIETRDERIADFHQENDESVIALRWQSWLLISHGTVRLRGATGGKLFEKGKKSRELEPESDLSFLMKE